MTGVASSAPRLHIPDEPAGRKEAWRDAVLGGEDLAAVIGGPDGVADWLWGRWRVLERSGLDRDAFGAIALAYRRELWLWLNGDRTWGQCFAGLSGRIERRLPG